jgi:1-deoxy-D-xylulose-5-phosphate synthase
LIPKFEDIDSPELLKKIPQVQLNLYVDWLRNYLIEQIAEHGGHFAANLGVVELTVALHYTFNAPKDILIWDVGHQAYSHKILTKRKNNFNTLRKLNGISGFPKMSESKYDAFGTGHSSSSISAALGYATAAKLNKIDRQHIAIIGDGAMSAGQAFEAINNAGISNTNITVIINDNHIGIDPSQGAFGEYLEQLEFTNTNLFADFGFQYYGPIDGHNLNELITIFETIKDIESPKVIHIRTVKGKGYSAAEAEQTKWHSTSKFDKLSGNKEIHKDSSSKFQDIFGKTLLELATINERIVAITPAMISGSSLHFMQEKFPERVFDVGIAEQHAVTFSAGLAASGLLPFCCMYSTFLQRGYDQLIHDVALQNLPVVFAIDRAGIVGEDGPTHHGVFDLAFLQTVPNLIIACPRNQVELRNMMYTANEGLSNPLVIRYPRGSAHEEFQKSPFDKLTIGEGVCLQETKSRIAVVSIGSIWRECQIAIKKMEVSHYDLRFVKPLDQNLLHHIFKKYDHVLLVEEGQEIGSISSTILMLANEIQSKCQIHILAIKDHFVNQGNLEELFELEGLNSDSIRKKLISIKNLI